MQTLLVIILVVVGVALLVVELFLIPGFGAAGVAGFFSAAAGVAYAYLKIGATAGHISLAAAILLCAVAVIVFLRSRALDKMALQENINAKVDLISQLDISVGQQAVTISRLAPMGKVRVNGHDIEAKSADEFIDQSTPVEIIAIDGNKVIVQPCANNK